MTKPKPTPRNLPQTQKAWIEQLPGFLQGV